MEFDIPVDIDDENCCARHAQSVQTIVYEAFKSRTCALIITLIKVLMLLAYIGYVAYAMHYSFGGEPEWRLLICSIFGLVMIVGFWFCGHFGDKIRNWKVSRLQPFCHGRKVLNFKHHLRW